MTRIIVTLAAIVVSTAVASGQEVNKLVPTGTLRVAVVNIGKVSSDYSLLEFGRSTLAPIPEKKRNLEIEIKAWQKKLDDGRTSESDIRQYQAEIAIKKRLLEDIEKEFQEEQRKLQEQRLVTHWKNIHAGIEAYAKQHRIDLVLGYGDPIEKETPNQYPNVNRKMQAMDAGSTVPLFFSPHVDITDGVIDLLYKMRREQNPKQP